MNVSSHSIILMLGPQGSGKGTQAKMLAQKLGLFIWDMGAVLREQKECMLAGGKRVGEIIDSGGYLSDAELFEVLEKRLSEIPKGQGIIFDGVPRSVGQAEFILDHARSLGFSEFVTINITLPREESVKRLLLRAEKEGRADDTREGIENRLKWTEGFMEPLLKYLEGKTEIVTIDGEPSIAEVTKEIDAALGLSS